MESARYIFGIILVLTCTSCTPPAEQRRIDAFGHIGDGDFDGAAEELRECLAGRASDEDRYLCYSLLADVRFKQGRWEESADAYRSAFAIRDRIDEKEGFGAPAMESLAHWAWAATKSGRDDEAIRVIERGVANRKEAMEGDVFLASMHLARARIADRDGEADAAEAARSDALVGCSTNELRYFRQGDGRAPVAWYLPTHAWCELHAVCQEAGNPGAADIRAFGLDQGYARREAELFADCDSN